MEDIDVKVNPANFIYKLTAPLVNRFIENKMSEFFPLEVNQKLGEVVRSKIPTQISIPSGEINVAHENLAIDSLDFAEDRIVGKTSIAELSVHIARV